MNTLSRRDFLKFAGLAIASGTVLSAPGILEQGAQLIADPQIRFGRNLIRGTAYGAILSSSDEGRTWKQVANLGQRHAVLQLTQKNGLIYANMSLGTHDFWLKSVNTQKWFAM